MSLSEATVLIVDDDPITLSVTSNALKGLCKIKLITQPMLALELIKQSPPDLLLLDVNMPNLDGYSLLEQLRADQECDVRCREVPAIFLTARSEMSDEERGLSLGAVDYVSKPINPRTLRMRVETQLRLQLALQSESTARHRADELLRVILPPQIAEELHDHGCVEPRAHPRVAVIFCDIVGFTSFSSVHAPEEIVTRLDKLFKRYEQIGRDYGVEKIKTIGDCFMAVAGLEGSPLYQRSALERAVKASLEMCVQTGEVVPEWSARAGVYMGPLVSGVVGDERYQFDVWGNTVNVASRLCGVSAPGSVALTSSLWELMLSLSKTPELYQGESLGKRPLKGLGSVEVMEVTLSAR